MTQLESAKKNNITPLLRKVAERESVRPEVLASRIANGTAVIPLNKSRKIKNACAIGEGLRIKVNANIGTSPDHVSIKEELKKLEVSLRHGADAVMDLSTGGDLRKIRKTLLKACPVPFGTVPIYEAVLDVIKKKGSIKKIVIGDILKTLEEHAEDGVDFFTIHAGLTYDSLKALRYQGRVMDIVSRGGAFLAEWMIQNKSENPLYEYFDEILKIAEKWDITLSLGDAMRPGSVLDATDHAQIKELIVLGELAERANEAGVQVIIEGPGHVPLNQIETNVRLEKSICNNRPFYVLGPLVTDIAPGYDHIAGAIGGAVAAWHGADFLCYLTPSEHLKLPSINDVKEGVIASRIAAHAADIARGTVSMSWDKKMSEARKDRDWKKQSALAINPEQVKKVRLSSMAKTGEPCTMCGELCSIKLSAKCMGQFSKAQDKVN